MKNILVPVDFESKSIWAVHTAVNIARQFSSKITLVHVVDLNKQLLSMSLNIEEEISVSFSHQREEKMNLLQKLIDDLQAADLEINAMVIAGDIVEVLERTIDSEEVDFVIMGSHGAAGIKEFFIGSNAEKIAKRIEIPILIQKSDEEIALKELAFVSDFSAINMPICEMLRPLEEVVKGNFYVVRINTPLSFRNTPLAQKQMREFARKFALQTTNFLQYDYLDFEDGINAFAQEYAVDCVVMAVHKEKTRLDKFHVSGLGSLINHVEKPLLILKE